MAFLQLQRETLVTTAAGRVQAAKALAGRSAIALYFGAGECPACRDFTPRLAVAYSTNLHAKGLGIVFVSSDEDEAQLQENLRAMLWPALPFEARDLKNSLREQFKVQGTLDLVIVDIQGNTITANGVAAITQDPMGETYPWSGGKPAALSRTVSTQLMEKAAVRGRYMALLPAVCCFWIPLLFFMGAANTLTTCESDEFGPWMKTYSILPLVCPAVLHVVAVFLVLKGCSPHLEQRYMLLLQGFMLILKIGTTMWGWVEYTRTSEERCVGDGDINPRTLALVFLIFDCCFLFCCMCLSVPNLTSDERKKPVRIDTE